MLLYRRSPLMGRICRALLVTALLWTLSGCALLDPSGRPEPPGPSLRPAEEQPSPPSARRPPADPSSVAEKALKETRRALEKKDFSAALGGVRRQIGRGVPEARLAGEYVRALNGLLGQAQSLMESGQPERAGPLWRRADEAYPQTRAVATQIMLDRTAIRSRIEASAEALMERGLVAYRAGDLEGAIRTWERIEPFAPGHKASQKALETARTQRKNLEKVGGGGK